MLRQMLNLHSFVPTVLIEPFYRQTEGSLLNRRRMRTSRLLIIWPRRSFLKRQYLSCIVESTITDGPALDIPTDSSNCQFGKDA